MASLSEIIQLCRLCLVKDHVNISIFDDPENVRQIPLKISSCLPVKISRDDNLPKKICDGCSSKLDLCYDFWTSTAQAEKTLLCMAKEKENQVPEAVIPQPLLLKVEPAEELLEETQICEPPVPKPIIVKKEVEPAPTSVENEAEEPAAKRPRRSAAIKAQMQIAPESDDDDAAEGLATTEDVADVEDDIEDPDIPDMNVEIDDVKPGPSGLNQRSADSENNLLTEKVVDHKGKESYYKCLTCKECFDDVRQVKFHQHQPACKYFCERCRRQLDTKLAIVMHVIEHNMDDEPEPEYECEQCFLEFYNLNEYEHHQKSCSRETVALQINLNSTAHHSESEQNQHTAEINGHLKILDSDNILEKSKYYCKYCNIGFNSQSNLNNHLTTNSDGQQYGCHECGKFFLDKSFLVKHLEIDNRRKPNKCDTGLKCIAKSSNLNAPNKIHTDENRLKCNVCGKCFRRKYNLDRHIRSHTGEKPFKCKYCDKCFTQNVNLKSHIMIHTGEKPFKCNYCDKCFTAKRTLRDHITTHTGEKPFKCKYCDKWFSCAVNLKAHIRIHTGKKPFKCIYCDKCFTASSNLRSHIKTHTGEKVI